MDIPITFFDFKSEENYLALQNKYAGWSQLNPPNEPTFKNIVKNDFSIIYRTENLQTDVEDYKELYFIKDFLLYKIPLLGKRYIVFFKEKIESEFLIDNQKICAVSEIQLKKFIELLDIIERCDFLIKIIKVPLIIQVNVVINYFKNINILPNYSEENRFKVNFYKTDILVLFTLLREKGILNSPFDAELGLFIEKNFLYKNPERYSPIKNAGKVVNDVKNFNKPIDKTIQRLKDIFQNDDFYELEIR